MIRRFVLATALLIVVILPLIAAAAPAEVAPRAAAALAAADSPARRDDGRLLIWVFYRDKGLTGAALDLALEDLAAALPEKVAARRARVRDARALPVDAGDLPVHAPYLAAARAAGAELRHTSRWLNAASFLVTDAQLRRLTNRTEVARIDLVATDRRRVPPPPSAPEFPVRAPAKSLAGDWIWDYGASLETAQQLNVSAVHALGLTGADVVVGMLDTGFRTTHEALQHVPVLGAWDFVDGDPIVDEEATDPIGSRNHGTKTLSNVAAYRPGSMISPGCGVSVLLARTEHLTEEVPAEEDNWVAGLEWAEANGADIISSSLGYIDWYTFEDLDGNTAVTTRAADQAVARGLVVVTSAGNDRLTTGSLIAPADADSVITVGAVDADGFVASFTSPGPTADGRIKPDVAARGVSNIVVDPNDDLGYGAASGTSFSCPLVSGVAALILERAPDLTPMQVREALRQTASQPDSPDNDMGWGMVDAYGAVTWFGPVFDHTPLPDTEDTSGPYSVATFISARAGMSAATPQVLWRADGGAWQAVDLMPTGGGPVSWIADLPGQSAGTMVDYYLTGTDVVGVTVSEPVRAPERFHTFVVGSDTTLSDPTDRPVPDADSGGVYGTVLLDGGLGGKIGYLSVDIDLVHPDVGQLRVELISPMGTHVLLHNRSGSGTADLAGNWPTTLVVDGPGDLGDITGENSEGLWFLYVFDDVAGGTGTLLGWNLHLTYINAVSVVGDGVPGLQDRLLPNVPNPFNPRTEIRFELARGGRTRLAVFDLRGMLVRDLLDEDLAVGPHRRLWDGRDRRGRDAGSGVYLYRLTTPDGVVRQHKMTLLR